MLHRKTLIPLLLHLASYLLDDPMHNGSSRFLLNDIDLPTLCGQLVREGWMPRNPLNPKDSSRHDARIWKDRIYLCRLHRTLTARDTETRSPEVTMFFKNGGGDGLAVYIQSWSVGPARRDEVQLALLEVAPIYRRLGIELPTSVQDAILDERYETIVENGLVHSISKTSRSQVMISEPDLIPLEVPEMELTLGAHVCGDVAYAGCNTEEV